MFALMSISRIPLRMHQLASIQRQLRTAPALLKECAKPSDDKCKKPCEEQIAQKKKECAKPPAQACAPKKNDECEKKEDEYARDNGQSCCKPPRRETCAVRPPKKEEPDYKILFLVGLALAAIGGVYLYCQHERDEDADKDDKKGKKDKNGGKDKDKNSKGEKDQNGGKDKDKKGKGEKDQKKGSDKDDADE